MKRKDMKKVKNKRKNPIIRRLLFLTLLLFIGIGSYFGYVFYQTIQAANESYDDFGRLKSDLREEAVSIIKDPVSILLLGVEDYSSGGKGGRSDTIIVATFNPDDQTMKLLSIPRDTRVEIPGIGLDKITHSYSKNNGGKEQTINTVEQFLDIPIDYYATVNFRGFKDIIDEIGGITVDVPFDFWEKSDVDGHHIEFFEGEMDLDGEEALAYARMRKRDPRGDFGRNDRQKQIITAAVDQLMKPNNLFKIDDIAQHIGSNVQTNLRMSDALSMQQKYSNFNSTKIEQLTISGEDVYIDGIYYFQPEEESLTETINSLQKHLGQQTTISAEDDSQETQSSDLSN